MTTGYTYFRVVALLLLGGLSLGMLFLVFEYKYMWYVDHDQFEALRYGFLVGIASIVLLWVFFPNPWAVAVAGLLTLMFPVIFKIGRSTSLSSWTPAYIVVGVLCLLLLVATAIFRRGAAR